MAKTEVELRPDIQAARDGMNASDCKREVRDLKHHLDGGELVALLATGGYNPRAGTGWGHGLLAVTNRRMLFIRSHGAKARVKEFPFSAIRSVGWHDGLVFGKLTIDHGDDTAQFVNMDKTDGRALVKELREDAASADADPSAMARILSIEKARDGKGYRADIAAASERMSSRGARGELRVLHNHVPAGETVTHLATCQYIRGSGWYGKWDGLLAVTENRVIFLRAGLDSRVEDFPFGTITSVAWHDGVMFGTLTLMQGTRTSRFSMMEKPDGRAVTERLQQRQIL